MKSKGKNAHSRQQSSMHGFHNDPSSQSGQILLSAIKDQQIYLSLVSTFLAMAQEAGVSTEALRQIDNSLLQKRGIYLHHIAQKSILNKQEQSIPRSNQCQFSRGNTTKDMKKLLQKIEREVVDAKQKQKQYRSLKAYTKQKQEQITPLTTIGPSSKKARFKRMLNQKYATKNVQSSNFYEFGVQEILKNSFKSENECYRTINSFVYLKTMFGHSSDQDIESFNQIYNAIFDRSEHLIITGGQEGLIKIWHRFSGTLIKTLKGHTEFLNKIDTSKCNKYLLTCGADGIRFFDLVTLKSLGGWKTGSIDEITSFLDENNKNIFLFGNNSTLFALTEETMLASAHRRLSQEDFYIFQFSQYIRKDSASIIVIAISPQKSHIIFGLETGQFLYLKLQDITEAMNFNAIGDKLKLPCAKMTKQHYNEIIEIKWSDNSNMWATGSKDGRCCLWEIKNNQPSLIVTLSVNRGSKGRKKRNFSCTYICWNCTYSHFAAGFQQNIEQEDTDRGQGEVLIYSVKQRAITCELSKDISLALGGIKAMDSHPHFPNILLICEAEGHIILFDLFLGCVVNVFEQRGYHIMHPQFRLIPSECRFSQDGLTFIVATEYGSISIYGYDSKIFYSMSPIEQFFKTDFISFEIEDNSMKAIPLQIDFQGDINQIKTLDLLTIKGEAYNQVIKIDPDNLLYHLNSLAAVREHIPQTIIDKTFIRKIQNNVGEMTSNDQRYSKNYEEIQNNKQLILFHQRQRQFTKITSITSQKLKEFKKQSNILDKVEESKRNDDIELENTHTKTRKLKRNVQKQRIIYADDFQYNESQEEDFVELGQDEVEQESEEDQYDSNRQEEPRLRPREMKRKLRNTRHHNQIRYYDDRIIEESPEPKVIKRRRHPYKSNEIDREDDENQYEKRSRKYQGMELEESDQPKKLSRLRKQPVQSNQSQLPDNADCYRCQMAKSTHFCDKCDYTQKFCAQCSTMRGKNVKDKFKCIICLFIRNEMPQENIKIDELKYRITKRTTEFYLPQLEDQVRFFFQGYEEFLVQNINILNKKIIEENPEFRILPHTQNLDLINTPLCKIKTIKYYFPLRTDFSSYNKRNSTSESTNPILMLLGLAPVDDQIQRQSGQKQRYRQKQIEQQSIFWVFFTPGHDFILPEEIYQQVNSSHLIQKLQTNDLIDYKGQQIQIVEKSPFEIRYPQSIWKYIKMRKTEGKRLRGNTKDIQKRFNIWRLYEDIHHKLQTDALDSKLIQRLIYNLEKWTKENSMYCLFIDYVDFQIYPFYRHQIPLGICLLTILDRLRNNYYSSNQSLRMDIDLIYTNSFEFNGPAHEVTINAELLKISLYNLITSDDIASNSQKEMEKEENSNSKKDRKKQQKQRQRQKQRQKQDDEEVIMDSSRRRTRKDTIKLKKKKDSSDYSQGQPSVDDNLLISTRGRNKSNGRNEQQRKRITRSRTKNN